jgi:hypothetical protein
VGVKEHKEKRKMSNGNAINRSVIPVMTDCDCIWSEKRFREVFVKRMKKQERVFFSA